jgi:hypothetical protein
MQLLITLWNTQQIAPLALTTSNNLSHIHMHKHTYTHTHTNKHTYTQTAIVWITATWEFGKITEHLRKWIPWRIERTCTFWKIKHFYVQKVCCIYVMITGLPASSPLAANTLTSWRNFRCVYVQLNILRSFSPFLSNSMWKLRYWR